MSTPSGIDYAKLAQQVRQQSSTGAVDYGKLAEQARQSTAPPPPPAPAEQPSQLGMAVDAVGRMGKQVVKNVAQPFLHPLDTMISLGHLPVALLQNQGAEFDKAKDAYDKGDKGKAALHALAYLAPVVGPMLDSFATRTAAGEGPEVAGDVTSMFLPVPAAKKLPAVVQVGGKAVASPERAAVEFGLQNGIPVDAATATGNAALKGVKTMAEKATISGAAIARKGNEVRAEKMATLGEQLAAKANNAGQAVTIPEVGERLAKATQEAATNAGTAAKGEYAVLGKMETANPVAFAVDVKSVQDKIRPLHQQMEQSADLMVPGSASARALTAMRRLMSGPNTQLASVVDDALGELKGSLRSVSESDPMSKGAGQLSEIVKSLDNEVRSAVGRGGGKPGLDALDRGRAATVRKYDALDVVDQMKAEPVGTVAAITRGKDGGVAFLRDVRKHAPQELPNVGRAVMDDLMDTIADPLKRDVAGAKWAALGPETKRALFAETLKREPNYIKDLDNFFLLAKKLKENPNPSGTATTAAIGGTAGMVATGHFMIPLMSELAGASITAAMRSPRVVRALTRGLRLQTGAGAAAKAAATSEIVTALKSAGLPVPALLTAKDKE